MATTYFTHAMRDAIAEAMRDDPSVFVFGEDVDKSVLGPTQGLVDEFGSFRVRNTPDLRAGRARLADRRRRRSVCGR